MGGAHRHPESSSKVIILCFHGIGAHQREMEQDEAECWVTAAQFDEFLEVVRRHPNTRITFDDGNASDVDYALPALRNRDLSAAFFLIADRLDAPGSVSSSGARELARAGMTIGSHGMHHRPWRTLRGAALDAELVEAPRIIAGVVGHPILSSACPFGSYDRRVLGAARQAGITTLYTVDRTPARRDAWLQARYSVHRDDTPAGIEGLIAAPWGRGMAGPMRAAKNVLKRIR